MRPSLLVLLFASMPLWAVALPGCPRTSTTYCYPGANTGGCEGTDWEDEITDELLPDGDGTCPVGVYAFCPGGDDCLELDSYDVMEATCEHAYDHDWSDCSVTFLCGPMESINGCCFLVEVKGVEEG